MEIKSLIQKKKDVYSSLMEFIDATEDADFEILKQNFENQKILKNKEETISMLQLLSKIADNHHRSPDFIDKLSKIIQYLIQGKESQIPDFDIYKIFKSNKRILLLLFEQKLILPDSNILLDIKKTKDKNNFPYIFYLYPGIKSSMNEDELKEIEKQIMQNYYRNLTEFEEKCRIGENDSYICSLIRQDSIEEFIQHINKNSTSLLTQIQPSLFETNLFLMQKKPTFIEYASFYGSIQIIRYLQLSKVPLTNTMWLYSIHSKNADLIHYLELNCEKIKNFYGVEQNTSYKRALEESIICHHNDFADYLWNNFLDDSKFDSFETSIASSCNYNYLPEDEEFIKELITKPKKANGFNISQLCSSLTQITIPSSVTEIGHSTFSRCSTLTKVVIPESVTSIGEGAFSESHSLNEVEFLSSSSLKIIKSSAFSKCSSLKKIKIPQSVTSIGSSVFSLCSSLEEVEFPPLLSSIKYFTFRGCSSLVKFTIPSSVTMIEECAFFECSSLIEIIIPPTVTSIGSSAFINCKALRTIEIPSSVKSIGNRAFNSCSSLEVVVIQSSLASIKDSTFGECKELKQITIPSSVTSIEKGAFSGCSALTQITIPSSVNSIGDNAFYGCSSLTQITIPSSVNSIGDNAFSECSSLTLITFEIPSSVTSIGNHSFSGCSSLAQITIPSSVASIENNAFSGCSSLTQITFEIPSSVTSIGKGAFEGCSRLTQITIPSSVTSIGENAFNNCTSLPLDSIPQKFASAPPPAKNSENPNGSKWKRIKK